VEEFQKYMEEAGQVLSKSMCRRGGEREREREREGGRRQSMKRVCACVAVSESVFMCWPHMCQDSGHKCATTHAYV